MTVELAQTSTEARRRAWLQTACAIGAHIDDCVPCLCEWTNDCDEGQRLRAESEAAWTRYEGAS